MDKSWGGLEGCEATEKILHAAIGSNAGEVHLSADAEGGTVFFVSPERIEFFCHLPMTCRRAVQKALADIGGIDGWKELPVCGYGVFAIGDDCCCNLEIRIIKGTFEQDVIVKICR
jgi:hypothetical protein